MPIVEPPYNPSPKSGCRGMFGPMKFMIASELGSTEAFEISWFHALFAGKGTKPFRLAPRPRLMPLQELWANSVEHGNTAIKAASKRMCRINKPPAGPVAIFASYHKVRRRRYPVVHSFWRCRAGADCCFFRSSSAGDLG